MAITGIDTIEGKQIIAAGAVSAKSAERAFNDENGNPITGYQIAGEYYSASNPSGFITGVDLTPYQLTTDMTAYQPAGDYLTTGDSAEFYTTANESGFLTAHQSLEGYLQDSDLTIVDNKVTEISGVELSAGTELEFEYDAADNISAINNSAISDVGLQTFVNANSGVWGGSALPVSAGKGVKISLQDDTLVFENDETVLLNNPYTNETTTAFTVAEPLSNFQKIRFEGISHNSTVVMDEHLAPSGNENIYVMETYFCPNGDANPWQCRMGAYTTTDGLTYTGVSAKFIYMAFNNTTINGDTGNYPVINKIYGINRISAGE